MDLYAGLVGKNTLSVHEGTRSEKVDLARARNIDQAQNRVSRHALVRARKSACFRARTTQFRWESRRYLNFKSANVYFCPGPAAVPPSLSFSPLSLFHFPYLFLYLSLSVSFFLLSASFSRTFWISNSVQPLCRPSRQQATFECFYPLIRCHLFPSPSDLVYVGIPRSTAQYLWRVSRTFIYGATRYVSELILWFIPQSIARGSAMYDAERRISETLFRSSFAFDVACDEAITRYNFSRLLYDGESTLHSHVLPLSSTLAYNSRRVK